MRVRTNETTRPCDATEKFRLQGGHDPHPPLKRPQNRPKPKIKAGQVAWPTSGLVPERGRPRPFCALFEENQQWRRSISQFAKAASGLSTRRRVRLCKAHRKSVAF